MVLDQRSNVRRIIYYMCTMKPTDHLVEVVQPIYDVALE